MGLRPRVSGAVVDYGRGVAVGDGSSVQESEWGERGGVCRVWC